MGIDTNIVTIDLGLRSYDIYIGSGLLSRVGDVLPVNIEHNKFFIITDNNVEPYALNLQSLLQDEKAAVAEMLVLEPGEATKSFESFEKVNEWLLGVGANRDSHIIALGGGVVGDVAGFCASTILRGVKYVQIPTTLLSQVDSSVGGKTGINTTKGKNLVGSFYQPEAVVIDIETLQTLRKRELLAGYAEVAKYGLIADSGFFSWLEQNGKDVCALDENALSYAIETSVKAKAEIVELDETEQGRRALLNLGHTFGHALEAVAGYDGRLLHGEAVSIGIMMAFDLSERMNLIERADVERVERHFIEIGLPTKASQVRPALNTTVDELMDLMRLDKKVKNGKLRFILVNGIGDAYVEDDVSEKLVRDVLTESLGGEETETRRAENDFKESFGVSKVRGLWKSVFSSHS
ncbi:MAG: 3-dehydroquinate synthase [Pseudomonadota bacterium]